MRGVYVDCNPDKALLERGNGRPYDQIPDACLRLQLATNAPASWLSFSSNTLQCAVRVAVYCLSLAMQEYGRDFH